MRVFVALELPEALRNRLAEATVPLRAPDLPVRWVDPAQLHLTLKFIGQVEEERVERMSEALSRTVAGHQGVSLRLGGVGAFPSLRSPRVIWMGVEASPPLMALQEAVEDAMAELGVEPENRAFHPHVTLGRTRRRLERSEGEALRLAAPRVSFQAEHRPEQVVLMRSRLGRGGARYEVVSDHPMGAR